MLVFCTNLSLMELQVRYLTLYLLFLVIDDYEWVRMESLQKNIQLMLEFLKAPFLVLHFSCYTLMTFLTMLSVILLSMLMILLSVLSVIRHLIFDNSLNLLLIYETLWTGVKSGLLISMLGKISWFRLTSPITMVLWSFKMLGLTVSSKLNWGFYIISIAKTASKKIAALIRSMKCLSPEVALYLYRSAICSFMEYCCHVWAGACSCYLELLDKLQKQICGAVGPWLAACLEPLAHGWNLVSLSLFYRHYFGRCSSEQAQLVPLPFSWERPTRYSDRLHDFLSPLLDVTRMSLSTVYFLAQLDSEILYLQNAFLWPMILVALSP